MPVIVKKPPNPLFDNPILIGAGATYPYSDELMEACCRIDRYGEEFSMATVMGAGDSRRIAVPRNLVGAIGPNTKDLRKSGAKVSFTSTFKPRDDRQVRIVVGAVKRLRDGESFIIEASTGLGKTICTMDIIAQLGLKTIVVVTKEDIRDQWIAAAKAILGLEVGKGVGLIQGDKVLVQGQGIVIATIQSLSKENRYSPHLFDDFGMAVWDEVHRAAADFFSQSAFRIPAKLRLGLSATPDRKDGRSEVLKAHIGPVKIVERALNMIPRIIARTSPWKLPMTSTHDPKTGGRRIVPLPHSPAKCGHVINMLVKHHGRNQLIVAFAAAAYKKGRKILIQSDRTEHLEALASMISSNGVPPGDISYYVGGMTEGQRAAAKKRRVIMATYQMTAEATDIPDLDTLVMGTPKSDVVQIVGRILREYQGKKEPVVFDIVDDSSNVFKGFWNSRRSWYSEVGAEVQFN